MSTKPETVQIAGETYTRHGAPWYHVQISSYGGGFLGRADTTHDRARVGELAKVQAVRFRDWNRVETSRTIWKDCALRVTDANLTAGGRQAVLAVYRWNPVAGSWTFSHGTRIRALDRLQGSPVAVPTPEPVDA